MACWTLAATTCRRTCCVGAGAGLRLVALAVLAVVAAALSAAPPALAVDGNGGGSNDPVYLLNAMYSLDPFMANDAKALWLGIDAALYASGYKTANGRPIKIVDPDPKVDSSNITAVVRKALEDYPTLLGVIGPFLDPLMWSVLETAAFRDMDLMFLGPFTGSSAVRVWSDSVYYMRAEPRTEITVMLTHILKTIRARRTAFMYLTGVQFGDSEYQMVRAVFASFSLEPPALYSAPHSMTDSAVDMTVFDAMANTYPQVIILWGMPGRQVAEFLRVVLTDPRTSSAYIMTCFPLQRMAFQVYYDLAMAGKLTPVDGQLMSSANTLPVSYANVQHVELFRAEMGKYMEQTGRVDASLWADEAKAVREYGPWGHEPPSSDSAADVRRFFNEHPSSTQLMFAGWLPGKVIMQTLDQPLWITDRRAYVTGLFDQNRYIISEDYVLGDYGAPCTPVAAFLGAVCYCNQGGRAAILQHLHKASWTFSSRSAFNYAQSVCYLKNIAVSKPLSALTLNFSDFPKLTAAAARMRTVIQNAVDGSGLDFAAFNPAMLNATQATGQGILDRELLNYTVDVITGPLLRSIDVNGTLVISPVFNRPSIVVPKSNYLFLMPTLEQEMYVLYSRMAVVTAVTSISAGVNLVLHEYSSASVRDITALGVKTAATFNLPDPSTAGISPGASVATSLAPDKINFVLGITEDDVGVIASFLVANPSAIAVISFCDLAHSYDSLVAAFSVMPTSVQARLMSFTSLPLWSDTSESALEASPLMRLFTTIFPDPASHTPSLLRNFLSIAFIQAVAYEKGGVVNSTSLQERVYTHGTINAHSMSLGPFQWSCTTTASGDDCIYENYGAQSIVMLSVQRMLDPRVPPLTAPMTPSLVYRPRVASSALTPAERNGIIAGVVLLVVASIAAVGLLLYCCMDNRDNDAAPKDGDEPVTLVFTDIESSTALWAALPQLMADAIVAHHRVIRQLIAKHGCYEVKTIGDSFMIACKSAHSAVRLACEIQTKLLGHDWGTVSIDAAYREFELARADADDDYVPPTARLSEEEYAAVWCGLRVRVGVHTGLCDIRYDEVTKGYDYYGDAPNMAARTEAVANGGQVVATETAWWALSNEERAGAAHTAMGRQGLRGVPFAVEMFQMDAVPGRRHAALRTEIEAILPDETATETASSAAGALLSSVGTMSGPAAGIALVLTSCFAPYPVAQRVRELQPLLSKWGVGAPPRSRAVSEEDYCQGLMNRLALRIATVSQARQRMGNGGAVVAGDMPDVGAGGALNPLVGGGGCGAGGAAPRPSGMTAPPRSEEPSAMRESRLFRRAPLGVLPASRAPASKKESCSASTIGWRDDVMPFTGPASRRASEERNARRASGSMSDEVIVVRMPRGLGWPRHPNMVEPCSGHAGGEASLE
nr:unnamed protein product [Leishmania braziliensis]